MPHRYLIDPDLNCIFVRYRGLVRADELDHVRLSLEADPLLRPGMNRVWDQRDCDIQVTPDELSKLAENWNTASHIHGKRKLAYLIDKDLSWGFNRIFEAHRVNQSGEYNLFRDYDEAKQWLGLPADVPDPRELLPDP